MSPGGTVLLIGEAQCTNIAMGYCDVIYWSWGNTVIGDLPDTLIFYALGKWNIVAPVCHHFMLF